MMKMHCPICDRDVTIDGSDIHEICMNDGTYVVKYKSGKTVEKRAFWCPACDNDTLIDTDGRVWYIYTKRSARTGFLVELAYI